MEKVIIEKDGENITFASGVEHCEPVYVGYQGGGDGVFRLNRSDAARLRALLNAIMDVSEAEFDDAPTLTADWFAGAKRYKDGKLVDRNA